MRITDPLNTESFNDSVRKDYGEHKEKLRLTIAADKPVELLGPATPHAIDEIVSALFARAPLTHLLAEAAGLPLIYLDGSTMMTTVDLTGGDAVFRTSRPSTILEGLIQHGVGNPLVVFDEVDKLADISHGARDDPAGALLPFLEHRTAGRVREHFLGVDLDLRFLNWVLLVNESTRCPGRFATAAR